MNGTKLSPFVAILVALVVLVGGGLGFLGFQAYTNYDQVSVEYEARVARLHTLQNRVPFPSQQNLQAITEASAEFKGVFDNLLEKASALNPTLEEISPQAFQDRLRAVVSEVQAAATEATVMIPEDFYMGFDQYERSLPSERAAAALARQLASLQFVVQKLINLRVTSIDSIQRSPLPEESAATPESEVVPVVQSIPFQIAFTAEQGRLRQILNAVVAADRFFIVRAISVANSAPAGPPRNPDPGVAVAPVADLAPDIFGTTDQSGATEPDLPGLNVLVGRETLSVAANLELILINPPVKDD